MDNINPRTDIERLLLQMQQGDLDPETFARRLIDLEVFMPVKDDKHQIAGFQTSTKAEPLVLDSFERALVRGDWVACFTDGVEEEGVEGIVRQGQVTAEGVKILVERCARSTNDDATLILLQSVETIDWDALLRGLADYARLGAGEREGLIGRLQDAPLGVAGATARRRCCRR